MKIALIIHEMLVEGGGERQCAALARALTRQGHDVMLFTSSYNTNCFPEICKDVKVQEIGRGWLPWLRKPLPVRGYLDMLHMVAKVNERYDIWNPQHWPAQWGAIRLKEKLGGAVAWMCNDVPNFHLKATKPASLANFLLAPLYWLYYLCDRRQTRKVDITVLVSKWAQSEFTPLYPGKTRVLGPGVDTNRFRAGGDRNRVRHKFSYSEQDFVLLWLGILMPHRRLEDAIEAVGRLSSSGHNIKLLLAGSHHHDLRYCRSLEALTERLKLKDIVTFAGKVPDEEICDYYAACDAFLFPNDQQTWGLAVLEAMACGRPVLVSRGSGVSEALTDSENAILFSPRNPAELAEKIGSLISRPELQRKLAENGMRLACEHYTWEEYAKSFCEICREVTAQEMAVPSGPGIPAREIPSAAELRRRSG